MALLGAQAEELENGELLAVERREVTLARVDIELGRIGDVLNQPHVAESLLQAVVLPLFSLFFHPSHGNRNAELLLDFDDGSSLIVLALELPRYFSADSQ